MVVQHALHLVGEHVLAAADDHVAGAARQEQVIVVVEVAEIAGVHPALVVDGHAGLLVVAPVAVHGPERLQLHLADHAGRDGLAAVGVHHAHLHVFEHLPY